MIKTQKHTARSGWQRYHWWYGSYFGADHVYSEPRPIRPGPLPMPSVLAGFGAEIIRFAVPDMAAAKGLKDVVAASPVPQSWDRYTFLTTAWLWHPSIAGSRLCASIRAISVVTTRSSKSSTRYGPRIFPSASVSTAAPYRPIFWLRTAVIRRQRVW